VIKKLTAIGNSLGVVIDRPILDLLDITKDTPLELKTDGEALIIRPVKLSKKARVRESAGSNDVVGPRGHAAQARAMSSGPIFWRLGRS
jgi:antitoxin MazE